MGQQKVPNLIIFMLLILPLSITKSETQEVRLALVQFMNKISTGNVTRKGVNWGWNSTSDPCSGNWVGVNCSISETVKKIVLDGMNLTGVLDAKSLCVADSLAVFSINDNNIGGELPQEISNCTHLTHLYLHNNNFSGDVPSTLSKLSNLKRVDISDNGFSGKLPNLPRISGLISFLAQNNHLNGQIPQFDFYNLEQFNVSNNNFTGPIPMNIGNLTSSSFLGNEGLCGAPFSNPCPDSSSPSSPTSPPPLSSDKKMKSLNKNYMIYIGYAVLIAVIIALLIAFKFKKRKNNPKETRNDLDKEDNTSSKPSTTSTDSRVTGGSRSEFSLTSPDNTKASTLVVLSNPVLNGLKFEDLLRAPAELIGKGKHGTLYKVKLNGGLMLAVKRIKDWDVSRDEFKKRMHNMDKVRHRNVLPVAAYYCSRQEKLLVYEFQQNGSLFKLLHGSQHGETFDWESRLNIALNSAKAMAFMHEELKMEDMAHGNLKSSNIVLNKDMEPCISEYGLMGSNIQEQQQHQLSFARNVSIEEEEKNNSISKGKFNGFKGDIYAFGVILLELLTGKLVHNRRSDLARWVNSVVREEWTAEVFDKGLVAQGVSEERMVNLLQVALKCINPLHDERPNMSQVAVLINTIKEDEDKSLVDSYVSSRLSI